MQMIGAALGLAVLAAGCARPRPIDTVHPAGPGLLDGRPAPRPGTYRLVGWVLADNTGRPVSAASVTVPGTTVGTYTDEYGRYILNDVPEGHDSVRVRRMGFGATMRTFERKTPNGLYTSRPHPTYTDTLNFWLHPSPLHYGF